MNVIQKYKTLMTNYFYGLGKIIKTPLVLIMPLTLLAAILTKLKQELQKSIKIIGG